MERAAARSWSAQGLYRSLSLSRHSHPAIKEFSSSGWVSVRYLDSGLNGIRIEISYDILENKL